ncbi:hypothetical protein COI69_11850 [Bacillus cereus]|uniref:Uncharacterized protein n=1 Tax=Bacillus cereus TaxID=1396 RepID=A0A9X7E7I3_BACCE|nr:hypothetical protein [Bacillus thuringiensis]PHA12958.1 hypothetical protein COE70_29405 [Bacillus cereus]PHG82501.1 hypothetical protein COI69_11850 [Bacillus cereus]
MYVFIKKPPLMSLDFRFGVTYVFVPKLLLFSAYNTLKCVLFIMLNIFHNSTCKQEMNKMYFKVHWELVSVTLWGHSYKKMICYVQ